MERYAIVTDDESVEAYAGAVSDAYESVTHITPGSMDDAEWRSSLQGCTSVVALGGLDDEIMSYLDTLDSVVALGDTDEYEDILSFDYTDAVTVGVYTALTEAPERKQAERLATVIDDRENWAVGIHNNPDPDAISSAVAFCDIADQYNLNADVLYGGEITHQENTALENVLDLDLVQQGEAVDLEAYDGIAMLDTASIKNIDVIDDLADVDVIIDHHTSWDETAPSDAEIFDVRTDRGATAGIMTDYLRLLDITPEEATATALVHGIYADTDRLMPGGTGLAAADVEAVGQLYQFINESNLAEILHSQRSEATLKTVGKAALNYDTFGATVISYLEDVEDVDAIPQAADFLNTLDSANTAIASGVVDDEYIKISARSTDIKLNIGDALEDAFHDDLAGIADADQWGAGGHQHMGGASLPITLFNATTDLYHNGDTEDAALFHDTVKHWLNMRLGDISRTG